MNRLDEHLIKKLTSGPAHDNLANVWVLSEIDSTNSYLMQMDGPPPGKMNIAATNNQTAGRGRHGKVWQSPPGSGLCMSAAYTFASQPENLPAVTLALGLAAVRTLEDFGACDIELKWPNDLIARDGKLGGILTEVQPGTGNGVTVVTGIGINIDLERRLGLASASDWARQIVDLKCVCEELPAHEAIAGKLSQYFLQAFIDYESSGFQPLVDDWSCYDWLLGRDITVDTVDEEFSGVGAGVAQDGALLIDTPDTGIRRVTSGTIVNAGERGLLQ